MKADNVIVKYLHGDKEGESSALDLPIPHLLISSTGHFPTSVTLSNMPGSVMYLILALAIILFVLFLNRIEAKIEVEYQSSRKPQKRRRELEYSATQKPRKRRLSLSRRRAQGD